MKNRFHQRPLLGDYLVIAIALLILLWLFKSYWHLAPASRLQIRQDSHVVATLSLDQVKQIPIKGRLGVTWVQINHGRARISASPCVNQYCVHQGWLSHQGETSLCLPNRVSIHLMGAQQPYDSLNY